jgi:site-specific recombinase XerD
MDFATFHNFLTLYKDFLLAQKKQNNTIRSYANDALQFYIWLKSTVGEDLDWNSLVVSDIRDFRAYLRTRDVAIASVNHKLSALKHFFEFCVAQGIVEKNPVRDVPPIKNVHQAPAVISRKESLLLIRSAEQSSMVLETAIVLLQLHCGLKNVEICALTVGDLHLSPREGRLFIRGQRGKAMRFVYLTSRAQVALRNYCSRRGISFAKKRRGGMLFHDSAGGPLTPNGIDHIVRRIARRAGIPHATSTNLRNTFIIQALASGETVESVARVIGAASLKSLQRYVQLVRNEEPSVPAPPKANRLTLTDPDEPMEDEHTV